MSNSTRRKKTGRHAIWWLQAAGLKLFWGVSARLPPARASAFGRRLIGWVGPRSRMHTGVLANLCMAFPERSPAEIRLLGAEMWESLGATLAEYPHLRTLAGEGGGSPHLEVRNLSGVEDLGGNGPFIFISAHLANWELMALAVRHRCGRPLGMLYNPQKNPRLEAMIQGQREAMKSRYIPVKNAVHGLFRSLRRGESVALLMDYRVKGGDLIPFFGVPATTSTAPAWLAARTGCGVIPVGMERLGDARYRLTFHPPLYMEACDKPAREAIDAFTGQLNERVADLIRATPGQWLCTKRRWPEEAMKNVPGRRTST